MHGDETEPADLIGRPAELRNWLTERGVFRFRPYRSGLFPASDLSPEDRLETGMGMAWFRDNAHVAMALFDDGRTAEASRAASAVLSVLRANRGILRDGGGGVLPVRVDGDTLENDTEARVQHDSTGYALWLVSRVARSGALEVDADDLQVLAETATYLVRNEYWRAADDGHWEEDRRIHASSIGTVVAGLREASALFEERGSEPDGDIRGAIRLGREQVAAIVGSGRTDLPVDDGGAGTPTPTIPTGIDAPEDMREFLDAFDVGSRRFDAALLFLVEPLDVLPEDTAARVVADVEENLVRARGVARYRGDTYWEPRFPHIMSVDERTSAAEGRTERRNLTAAGVALTGTEAQWTLFDPILSVYWADRFRVTGLAEDRDRQLHHLRRSLRALVPLDDSRWGLPEAYYLEHEDGADRWIGNPHTPLLWSQANLLRAVRALEATS